MPRKVIPPEEIDEDLLRDLVGQVSPVLRDPDAVLPPAPEVTGTAGAESASDRTVPVRRRRIVLPDYGDTFLRPTTLRRRVTININEQTRDMLITILQHIGPYHLSLGGYVENILRHHIETFRDEINALNRNKHDRKLL